MVFYNKLTVTMPKNDKSLKNRNIYDKMINIMQRCLTDSLAFILSLIKKSYH